MANGKVVQVIGTVVDVEFPAGQLPALFNAIEVNSDGQKIVLEAESHLPNDWIRFVSLSPTEVWREALKQWIQALPSGFQLETYFWAAV